MLPTSRVEIREFGGKIIGWLETDKDGNQQISDFYGKILGFYDKPFDVTRDFYGKIVSRGNTITSLLYRK